MEQPEQCVNVSSGQEQGALTTQEAIPGNESILSEWRVCEQEPSQGENGVVPLRQLLEKDLPPSKRVEVLYDLIYALYDQDNLKEAILYAEELLDAYPDYRYLDTIFWLLGKMYATRANLPEHSETRRQDLAAAEKNLRRALDHIDDKEEQATILVELGIALSSSGKLADAQRVFEQASQIGIEDPTTRSSCDQWLGSIYEELGDISFHKDEYQQAADNYQAALQRLYLPEKQVDIYYKLSIALRWHGQCERALEFLRQALALELSSRSINRERIGELLFHMGQCAYTLRDFQQAIVLLEKAAEKVNMPKRGEVHLLLGHSYSQLKRFNNAAEFYGRALKETRLLSSHWRQAMKYLVRAKMAR